MVYLVQEFQVHEFVCMYKRATEKRVYLLECTPVPDITNTRAVLLQHGIKIHIKEVLEFNGGHEQAEPLRVIYVSLSLH